MVSQLKIKTFKKKNQGSFKMSKKRSRISSLCSAELSTECNREIKATTSLQGDMGDTYLMAGIKKRGSRVMEGQE